MSGMKKEVVENGSSLPRGLLGREGMPLVPGGRLPSFKQPRDLTLGVGKTSGGIASGASGAGSQGSAGAMFKKKVFKPNIPVRGGVKEEIKKEADDRGRGGKAGGRSERGKGGRGRGARGRKGKADLIQTTGSIFSEGIASDSATSIARGRSRLSHGDSESKSLSVPRPKLNFGMKVDQSEEADALDRLLRSDFIDDIDNDEKSALPIQLPMLAKDKVFRKDDDCDEKKVTVKVKTEPVEMVGGVKIKQEKMDEDVEESVENIQAHLDSFKAEATCKSEYKVPAKDKQLSIADLMKMEGQMVCVHLPDLLPFPVESVGGTKPKNATIAGTVFKDLRSGKLGTLKIHRSGKVKLELGVNNCELEVGTSSVFLQELLSFRLDETRRFGEVTTLGYTPERVVCMPDWGALVGSVKR